MKSTELKCIYIHIPKTAGTSISRLLGASDMGRIRGSQDHRTVRNIQDGFIPEGKDILSPTRWAKYLNQSYKAYQNKFSIINRNEFDGFFKFAIVRNPWDRVYSWYRNVTRDPVHLKQHGISEMISFEEFLFQCADSWALRSQYDWLVNSCGDISVDYVGRFENLHEDILYISERIGVNAELSHELKSDSSHDYRSQYTYKTRSIIQERYHQDISFWGYSF